MGFAYSLMAAEWQKAEHHEQYLYGEMEQNRSLRLPAQLFELVSRWRGSCLGGPPSLELASAPYKKIGMLLDFIELRMTPGDPSSFLAAIEHFGSGVGQWLKVAADCKAQVVESALRRVAARKAEACAELGTYVGYTAIRLARWLHGPGPAAGRGVSLEVDPIHALLTRHNLSLAHMTVTSEVWIGQALDVIPRLAEDLGERALAFVFMDHRGTRFHTDLVRLQRHAVVLPDFTHVCDNTLKPGAPVCLWGVANRYGPRPASSASWSLNEFAHWNSEDWMLVSGHSGY